MISYEKYQKLAKIWWKGGPDTVVSRPPTTQGDCYY